MVRGRPENLVMQLPAGLSVVQDAYNKQLFMAVAMIQSLIVLLIIKWKCLSDLPNYIDAHRWGR